MGFRTGDPDTRPSGKFPSLALPPFSHRGGWSGSVQQSCRSLPEPPRLWRRELVGEPRDALLACTVHADGLPDVTVRTRRLDEARRMTEAGKCEG